MEFCESLIKPNTVFSTFKAHWWVVSIAMAQLSTGIDGILLKNWKYSYFSYEKMPDYEDIYRF